MMGSEDLPVVSVVVPMLDEAGFIEACLQGFEAQDYPAELLDVVVVDGGSTDGSRDYVDKLAERVRWVRVVENPKGRASAAFNAGVAAAKGSVVCLFSAHGVPDPGYVRRSVEVLEETGAAGVGGRYVHEGLDPTSSAVGLAMVSPFGMASPHRFATSRCEVDTISHPAYRRSALEEVGPFDETLMRNSDYELNHRIRDLGLTLVFEPSVVSIYRPRGSLRALGRQFWWYGRWKERVVRRHPRSLKARHLIPPAAVFGGLLSPALVASARGRRAVTVATLAYTAMVGAAVVAAEPRRHGASVPTLALSFPVMHASWGAGFLLSLAEDSMEGLRDRS
jgi:glycosyltransferase involved in cell wall biosynthesis